MTSQELAIAITEILRSRGSLPVPLRALIAATLICERGGAPSRLGMSKVGRFSYGSSQNHYASLLTAIVEELPRTLTDMASGGTIPAVAATLRADLQERDLTIRKLRTELREMSKSREDVRRYALAVHERLRNIDAQAAAESGAKIIPFHPLS